MYRDPELPRYWYALLGLLFVLAVAPTVGLSELSEGEAAWALTARHIIASGQWVDARPPGVPDMIWPLQGWLTVPLAWGVPLSPSVLRLMAMLPVIIVASLAAWVSRKVAGPAAGAVSAAIVLFSFPMLQEGVYGSGTSLFPCLINAAWLTWFYYIRENRNWLFAWLFSLGLTALAMLVVGPAALLFFYLPLFFLSRPLRPWRRIILWQHWLSLALLATAVLLWLILAPGYRELNGVDLTASGGSYVLRLVTFPLLAAGMYMPWLLLTWPAFCAAFTPLEPARALGRFLRTIVFTVFGVSWLMPEAGMSYLPALIGPLAILAGMHYPQLMRRYPRQMLVLPRILSIVALVAVLGGFAGLLAMQGGFLGEALGPRIMRSVLVSLGLGLAITFVSVGVRGRLPLWVAVACGVVALQITRSGALQVLTRGEGEHQQIAESLLADIPADAPIRLNQVSQDADAVHPGPIVAYYLQRDLIIMTTPYDVGSADPVYVLQQNHTPSNRYRLWTPIGNTPAKSGELRLRIWSGQSPPKSAAAPPPATLPAPPAPLVPLTIPNADPPIPRKP